MTDPIKIFTVARRAGSLLAKLFHDVHRASDQQGDFLIRKSAGILSLDGLRDIRGIDEL
jgi:hypothetical protein